MKEGSERESLNRTLGDDTGRNSFKELSGWMADHSRHEAKRKRDRNALCHIHKAYRPSSVAHEITATLWNSGWGWGWHMTWGWYHVPHTAAWWECHPEKGIPENL